jgi:hypothetical protein
MQAYTHEAKSRMAKRRTKRLKKGDRKERLLQESNGKVDTLFLLVSPVELGMEPVQISGDANFEESYQSHPSHEFLALLIFAIYSVSSCSASCHLLRLLPGSHTVYCCCQDEVLRKLVSSYPAVSTWVGVLGLTDQLLSPMTNSPSRIPSLPLSRFTEEGKGFRNLCMYNKSTHIDQKRQSLKTKNKF